MTLVIFWGSCSSFWRLFCSGNFVLHEFLIWLSILHYYSFFLHLTNYSFKKSRILLFFRNYQKEKKGSQVFIWSFKSRSRHCKYYFHPNHLNWRTRPLIAPFFSSLFEEINASVNRFFQKSQSNQIFWLLRLFPGIILAQTNEMA